MSWTLVGFLLWRGAVAAASGSGSGAVVQLDALGDGVRIRVAPPGGGIVEPPIPAIQLPSDGGPAPSLSSASAITNGNLMVTASPDGLITATRLSDKTLLLQQLVLQWGEPAPGSRPGSVSVYVWAVGATVIEKRPRIRDMRAGVCFL